ncbi:hypothetical protein M758_12G086400 [Ceratodon purpureus]|nr:hypothetical protein M758_12G086400 [Ceratodon purpureus]
MFMAVEVSFLLFVLRIVIISWKSINSTLTNFAMYLLQRGEGRKWPVQRTMQPGSVQWRVSVAPMIWPNTLKYIGSMACVAGEGTLSSGSWHHHTACQSLPVDLLYQDLVSEEKLLLEVIILCISTDQSQLKRLRCVTYSIHDTSFCTSFYKLMCLTVRRTSCRILEIIAFAVCS